MKKSYIYPLIAVLSMFIVNSCLCSGSYSSKWDNDPEYWRSVNRENQLRKAGMDNAADMERKQRLDYMRGRGYTSPSGEKQIHYNGSQEQKRDLNAIDEYARTHPEF